MRISSLLDAEDTTLATLTATLKRGDGSLIVLDALADIASFSERLSPVLFIFH